VANGTGGSSNQGNPAATGADSGTSQSATGSKTGSGSDDIVVARTTYRANASIGATDNAPM
jgi:hypothetical protein